MSTKSTRSFCQKPVWQKISGGSYIYVRGYKLRFQLHSKQFKKENWFETFFISHNFSRIIGRHLGYIEKLNDARVASLGLFKDNVCTTRINKEKKFKNKFQVLLKFALILLD